MLPTARLVPTLASVLLAAGPLLATPSDRPAALVWQPAGEAPGVEQEHVLRSSLLRVNPEVLSRQAGRRLVDLELFDGRMLSVELTPRGSARPGSSQWFGTWDEGRSSLTLVVQGDAVAATLREGDQLMRVLPVGPGLARLELTNDRAMPGCATHGAPTTGASKAGGAPTAPGAAPAPGGSPAGGGAPIPVATVVSAFDAMVVYTPQFKSASGGTNGALALIDLAVQETNQCYQNSGANCAMRLVHTHEVSYSDSGNLSTDLNRLKSKTDGYMDEVHDLRTQYGADAVGLLVNSGGACGVAKLMTNVSNSFKSNAFNVTVRSCATGYYTFGHEFGHNFGLAHDPDNAGSASKSYAYGFRTANSQYRSVMAYAPGTRVPVFSSPDASWNGQVMGDGNQDNARALTQNGSTIEGWYPTQVPVVDCNGNGLDDQLDISIGIAPDNDLNGIPDDCSGFWGDVGSLSITTGGTQNLFLDAGPEHGGELFVLLGSLTGTDPGIPFGADTVPLVYDAYTQSLLASPGASVLSPVVGFLDPQGTASAAFSVPPGALSFGFLATPANHAFLTLTPTGQAGFVSEPVQLLFSFL